MSFAFIARPPVAIALAFAALLLARLQSEPVSGIARMAQQAPVTLSPQQQTAMAQQTQQYQQRAATLDRDNQELQSMLAQSRQQTQVLEEQVRATQTQLKDTTDRLARCRPTTISFAAGRSAMAASMQTRNAAEIRANNTLLRSLTVTNMPGINVRQDGDVIRIELPGDQLFNFGTAQLKLGADALLKTIAADLTQNYPQQLIGIEGHTDGSPMTSPQYPDRSASGRRPGDGRLRRPDALRRHADAATLCRGPRRQPPGRLERHRRRPGPKSPHRSGDLSGDDAAVGTACSCRRARC